MNTREKAVQGVLAFLKSHETVLFLNGTHQFEKHPIALAAALGVYPGPATVLFRVNHRSHAEQMLEKVEIKKVPKSGDFVRIQGGSRLYVDTINKASWKSSPSAVDVAVVYPVDSLKSHEGD